MSKASPLPQALLVCCFAQACVRPPSIPDPSQNQQTLQAALLLRSELVYAVPRRLEACEQGDAGACLEYAYELPRLAGLPEPPLAATRPTHSASWALARACHLGSEPACISPATWHLAPGRTRPKAWIPDLLRFPPAPAYRVKARNVVHVFVSTTGAPRAAFIAEANPPGLFESHSLALAWSANYEPATAAGKATAGWCQLVFNYRPAADWDDDAWIVSD